jgi:hypothetical protein
MGAILKFHQLFSRKTLLGFTLSLVCSVLGCATSTGSTGDLPYAIDDFHSHLIWARYAQAASYLPSEERPYFLEENRNNAEISYTEFSVGSLDLDQEAQTATVIVTLKWYVEPNYTVQETQIQEHWRFNADGEQWVLVSRMNMNGPVEAP